MNNVIIQKTKVKIKRNEDIILESSIKELKREKETVQQVKNGMECGILIEDKANEVKEGDIIESFEETSMQQQFF